MENTWTMEEANHDFSAVAEAAYAGHPQYIKNDLHPDLVIVIQKTIPIRDSVTGKENKNFIDFLLSPPRGDWKLESDKDALKMRDIDF